MYAEEVYYSFMRYYGVATNAESTMDMADIALHDGKDAEFWEIYLIAFFTRMIRVV